MKLHRGDHIIVTAGKDKGRRGTVLKILPRKDKVIVKGMNMYKKHLKPRQDGQDGRIIERERPLTSANVAVVCQKCKQPTRIGYRIGRDDRKVRICRKCGGEFRSDSSLAGKKTVSAGAKKRGGKHEK